MLDPLTALGLATNVVQLVDFGLKACTKARDLAETGTTEDYNHLEDLIRQNLTLTEDLKRVKPEAHEQRIHALALSTTSTAEELQRLLSGLKLEDPNDAPTNGERSKKRKRTVATRLVKGWWKEKDVERLESKLKDLQHELMLGLIVQQK